MIEDILTATVWSVVVGLLAWDMFIRPLWVRWQNNRRRQAAEASWARGITDGEKFKDKFLQGAMEQAKQQMKQILERQWPGCTIEIGEPIMTDLTEQPPKLWTPDYCCNEGNPESVEFTISDRPCLPDKGSPYQLHNSLTWEEDVDGMLRRDKVMVVVYSVLHDLIEQGHITGFDPSIARGNAKADQLMIEGVWPTNKEVMEVVFRYFEQYELEGPCTTVRDLIIDTLDRRRQRQSNPIDHLSGTWRSDEE